MLKRFKKPLLIALVAVAVIIPIAFVGTDYFEVSKNLDIFSSLYKEVNTYYVDNVDADKLMRTGINSMLESLDPYTNYISEADIENFKFQTTFRYGGIGAVIRKKGENTVIIEPYENFPADKAGLQAGDIILEVDGQSTKGKSSDDVSKILKGAPGTTLKLLVQKPDNSQETKTLTREEIQVNSVPYYGMVNDSIGYIRLLQFTDHCGPDVAAALTDLEKKHKLSGLIFDLRGNPGGLLNEAVNVANVFLNKDQLIVSTKGKVKDWDNSYVALNDPIDTKIPLAVLTNSGSASASEIVSGSMQDLDRGVIIGQRTFGKGLVQTTRPLSYGTELKVTTAHYFTPSGRCIQALDYAHRNADGSVGKIPDSLKTAFKTKNGRTVYDGGGIDPDIKLPVEEFSDISVALHDKDLVFDYATQYRMKHATIPDAKDFKLSDADYDDFLSFIKGKDYSYTTETETELDSLKSVASKEKYFDAVKSDFSDIQDKLEHDKDQDLVKNKEEIIELLEEEIASRYYYEKGEIANELQHDPYVARAISILDDQQTYSQILNTSKN
jgi:carboxyl-terminal processing protease